MVHRRYGIARRRADSARGTRANGGDHDGRQAHRAKWRRGAESGVRRHAGALRDRMHHRSRARSTNGYGVMMTAVRALDRRTTASTALVISPQARVLSL